MDQNHSRGPAPPSFGQGGAATGCTGAAGCTRTIHGTVASDGRRSAPRSRNGYPGLPAHSPAFRRRRGSPDPPRRRSRDYARPGVRTTSAPPLGDPVPSGGWPVLSRSSPGATWTPRRLSPGQRRHPGRRRWTPTCLAVEVPSAPSTTRDAPTRSRKPGEERGSSPGTDSAVSAAWPTPPRAEQRARSELPISASRVWSSCAP